MTTKTRPSHEPIHLRAIEVEFLVDADESGGAATVFEIRVGAGGMTPPPHSHDAFEETVYGLEGELTFTIEGATKTICPGDALVITRGQVHGFANTGAGTARFLSVATPGVFGPDYFHELAGVLAAAGDGPPDLGAFFAVMQRHGLTPAPPPGR